MTTESVGEDPQTRIANVASSAVLLGTVQLGADAVVAQGAVIRSERGCVVVDSGSAILENSVVVGSSEMPVSIGRSSVFGYRCLVVGASVGGHCEIGNGTAIMPGAAFGERVFLWGIGSTTPCSPTPNPSSRDSLRPGSRWPPAAARAAPPTPARPAHYLRQPVSE